MGTWFDGLAKRSARVEQSDEAGLTRRQVLARGALVTGAAWTAPMLLTATPAWAAHSCPKAGEAASDCGDGTDKCCPTDERCFKIFKPNGTFTYECQLPVGAPCGNRGFGSCNGGRSTCDQACSTDRTPICGGPGSTCGGNADCADGRDCSPSGFCGGVGADCSLTMPCSPGSCRADNIATVCVAGTCEAV